MMEQMGWDPVAIHIFIMSNVLIFAAYAILGHRHFQLRDGTLEHTRYGLFILFCGIGHIVMAIHMLKPLPYLMTVSHALTAIVSLQIALTYHERRDIS